MCVRVLHSCLCVRLCARAHVHVRVRTCVRVREQLSMCAGVHARGACVCTRARVSVVRVFSRCTCVHAARVRVVCVCARVHAHVRLRRWCGCARVLRVCCATARLRVLARVRAHVGVRVCMGAWVHVRSRAFLMCDLSLGGLVGTIVTSQGSVRLDHHGWVSVGALGRDGSAEYGSIHIGMSSVISGWNHGSVMRLKKSADMPCT